MYIIKSIYYSF